MTRAPRFAIAHKFPAEEAYSVIEAVEISGWPHWRGNAGCTFKPVHVTRRKVSNATLHNMDEVRAKIFLL